MGFRQKSGVAQWLCSQWVEMSSEMSLGANGMCKCRSGNDLGDLKRGTAICLLFIFSTCGLVLLCPCIKNGSCSSIDISRILQISLILFQDIACIWSIKSIKVTHQSSLGNCLNKFYMSEYA